MFSIFGQAHADSVADARDSCRLKDEALLELRKAQDTIVHILEENERHILRAIFRNKLIAFVVRDLTLWLCSPTSAPSCVLEIFYATRFPELKDSGL